MISLYNEDIVLLSRCGSAKNVKIDKSNNLLNMAITDVVIIGSGNVAETLAAAISRSDDYRIVQIISRNSERGKYIAETVGASYAGFEEGLSPADIYIVSVSDNAIAEVSGMYDFGESLVVHNAGSVSIDELSFRIKNRGVLYPFQTFTAGIAVDFTDVPLFIEGSTKEADGELRRLASELSGNVIETTSQQRLAIHMSGVFACNFTNDMYAAAQRILSEYGLEPDILKPLIAETARKANNSEYAADVQTGPAVRGDRETIEKHLKLLENNTRLKQIYELISTDIWETSKKISQE